MKRNVFTRIFAVALSILLVFGLLPTGILSDLIPEVAPDIAPEASAVKGGATYLSGLFYVRLGENGRCLTDTDWTQSQPTFENLNTGTQITHEKQMWLFITGTDGHLYIRSIYDVMAHQHNSGTWGNRWLNWADQSYPCTLRIVDVLDDGPGNPTGAGGYKWGTYSLEALDNGAYKTYIKRYDANYYLNVSSNKLTNPTDMSGYKFYLEPCYDPNFETTRPIQFNNQPLGNTSFRMSNSGTSVTMVSGDTNNVNITWAAVKANNGYFFLINRSNGNYLTVGTATNAQVSTKSVSASTNPHNDASIQWQVIRQRYPGFGTYMLVNKGSGLILYNTGTSAGSVLKCDRYYFGNNMPTYFTMGYNADFGETVETPKFYDWKSDTVRYFPAKFSSQAGYVALRGNQAKSINGDKTGYLFSTAAVNNTTGYNANLTYSLDSNNHFVYNSSYGNFAEWPSSHTLGTTTMYFSFSQSSSPFFWIIGHGSEVSVSYGGNKYTTTNGIKEVPVGTSGTISLTASGHFGIFTNVVPDANKGSVTVTLSGTNNQVIHGNTDYTVTVKNDTSYAIDNVGFSVSVGGGGTATLKCSNGSNSGSTNFAAISGGSRYIEAGESIKWTITMKPGSMTAGVDYTIAANNGSYISFKDANSAPTSNTATGSGKLTLQECNSGNISASVAITSPDNPKAGSVSNGKVTYTITLENKCNHAVSGLIYTFVTGSTTIYKSENGTQKTKHSAVSNDPSRPTSIGANSKITIDIIVDYDTLSDDNGTAFAFSVSGSAGKCDYVSDRAYSSSNSTSLNEVNGDVTITVTPTTNSGSSIVVKGSVVYTVSIKNGTNHTIRVNGFAVTAGTATILNIDADGNVTAPAGSFEFTQGSNVTSIASGATVIIKVTVDTTKTNLFTAGKSYDVTSGTLSAYATSLISGTRTFSKGGGKVQTITLANGSVTSTITADGINNNGVGEGTVNYTVTLYNGTNHSLKDISFVVKDSAGNALFTVNANGTITVHNATLVKNVDGSALTVNGSLTNLGSKATVTVSGIQIDANATVLDASGRLILVATGSSKANNVYGSGADALGYSDPSDSFTIMVRHNVNLMVQNNWATSITADKIFAAMDMTGAYAPEKALGLSNSSITGLAITDKNGNTVSVSGFTASGSTLSINTNAAYTELILKVTYNSGKTVLVPIQVAGFEAGQKLTYVLDYGLPVNIPSNNLLNGTRLTVTQLATAYDFGGLFSNASDGLVTNINGNYGAFTTSNGDLVYSPAQILNGEDAVYVVYVVNRNSANKENVDFVNIYRQVSFIPSNVVYYEDTLGGINYPTGFEIEELGSPESFGFSGTQDLPTIGNMGFDDGSYADAEKVELSGESVHKIPVYNKQVTVTFTFTGTGFELLSRVNAWDSATLLIQVSPSGAENWTTYPVITRFDPYNTQATEVYQVPVFRLNEVEYGTYDVQVIGLPRAADDEYDENGEPVNGYIANYIYVDGIRIYNPLGNSELTENYGEEKGVTFTNLRDYVLSGKATLASFTNNVTGFTAIGNYYIHTNDAWFDAEVGGINELGALGANNEVLVRHSINGSNQMIVLKVKQNGTGLLQIGIHDIHDGKFDGTNAANSPSTVKYYAGSDWTALKTSFFSGTEQYYSIDLNACPTTSDGYILVCLQVTEGFVSFSNIKWKNLDFATVGEVSAVSVGFNDDGTMTMLDAEGNETIADAASLFNLKEINDILAQNVSDEEI